MNNNIINKPVIILGAGGHAKVVADSLISSGYEILGCVTPDLKSGTSFYGVNVLGDDNVIGRYLPSDVVLANGIGALPYQNLRRRIAKNMRDKGYEFVSVIHPSAIISQSVNLDEGVQVMAGAVIQADTRIGCDSIINTGALVDHDCVIGRDTNLAPGVVCSGGVNISDFTYIGTGTKIIHNISIGSHSVIAAGVVIYKDVLANVTFKQLCQEKIDENENRNV